MAKGQITDDDLRKGIGNPPGLDILTGTKPKKDNPFRSTTTPAPVEAHVQQISPVSNVVELRTEIQSKEVEASPKVEDLPIKMPVKTHPRIEEPESEPQNEDLEQPVDKDTTVKPSRKSDIYTERVTVLFSPEMRDGLEALARTLQRRKKSKDERITPNTVVRAAVRIILDRCGLKDSDAPNSEEELKELLEKRVRSRG